MPTILSRFDTIFIVKVGPVLFHFLTKKYLFIDTTQLQNTYLQVHSSITYSTQNNEITKTPSEGI